MSSEQYSDSLLQAMSIIANRAVSNANFNKTIQAVIVECKDATIEKYRVRYQDGFWEAYGNGSGVTYLPGTSVYILVPNGDMTQPKTIIGTVEKLGINYINTISEQDQYYQTGNNTLNNLQQLQLCSYQTKTIEIYKKDGEENLININEQDTAFYLQSSSHLKCSFNIKTSLDLYQRYGGNYGLKFYLNFLDRAKEEEVVREYIFDTYLMSGNPYLFTNKVSQTAVFEIDGSNFLNIDRIELFTEGFPKQEEGHPADIFISNLSIVGVNQLSEQEMNGVSLSFVARKGYIFNDSSNENDEREIEAIVRVLGKTVNDTISQKLSFYWFVQNISISKSSPFYNKYGGYGWRCLNPYKVLERDEYNNSILIDFNPMGSIFTVSKKDIKIKQQKYKCVVLYGNESFSKEFSIFNNDASYEIKIQSDKGTQFTLDSGHPTLKCILKHNKKEVESYSDYIFHWGVINSKGVFSSLLEMNKQYQIYDNLKNLISQMEQNFNSYSLLKNKKDDIFLEKIRNCGIKEELETNEAIYNKAKEVFQTFYKNLEIIYQNYIYNVNIKKIVNFNTFVCTILDNESNVIGSKEITLINNFISNGGYTLIINNGKQSFNYNEDGISPCKNEKINFIIPELSFTLLNEKGEQIDQNEIKSDNIKWIFPIESNTLLVHRLRDNEQHIPQTNGTIIYPKTRIFTYGILDKYINNRNDNDIQLQVTYNGYTLITKTDFFFTKEGFLGTNGTGTTLRIVPVYGNNEQPITDFPCVTVDRTRIENSFSAYSFNFDKLKAELYDNGELIYSDLLGVNLFYNWSILKNKENDLTNLKIVNNNGGNAIKLEYNDIPFIQTSQENLDIIATRITSIFNIIKVSVNYNQKNIYATLPIIVYEKIKNDYDLKLVPNTGFQYVFYAEDGTRPQYDNKNPFTFKLTQKLDEDDNKVQDITKVQLPDFEHDFSYTIKGNLNIKNFSGDNTCTLVPGTIYDGSILNNYLLCEVKRYYDKDKTRPFVIARALIPIHMMLNRYGHAALNDWDGNSIDIGNSSGDTILAPQVGAGFKENNTFTGILMGTIKNNSKKENGLFGYSDGARTIFLDAETGNANFGIAGNGQIQIDATKSTITGGGYNITNYNPDITKDTNNEGMLIHLKTPEIRFGSKKFYVTSAGQLYAQGGGQIAGWNIGTDKLTKDTVGMSSNNNNLTNKAFWAGDKFNVDFNGHVNATSIDIGGIDSKSQVYIRDGTIYSNQHNNLNSTGKGFFLDNTGLSIGENFKVSYDNEGNSLLTARRGYIGNGTEGFEINSNSISNGKVYLGTDKISLGSTFSVNNKGYLTATSGQIANWYFSDGAFYNYTATLDSNGNSTIIPTYSTTNKNGEEVVNTKGMYFGKGGIRFGANFHVGSNGSMYAVDGTIGGWDIGSSSLKGGSLKLNSDGSIQGSNWSISSGGEAKFLDVKTANIKGGEISGGTRSGGSITGGRIDPGGVTCGAAGTNNSMNLWCEDIVTKKISADYIKGKIADITTLIVGGSIFLGSKVDGNRVLSKDDIQDKIDAKYNGLNDSVNSLINKVQELERKIPKT